LQRDQPGKTNRQYQGPGAVCRRIDGPASRPRRRQPWFDVGRLGRRRDVLG
jgi:hypothetical protein